MASSVVNTTAIVNAQRDANNNAVLRNVVSRNWLIERGLFFKLPSPNRLVRIKDASKQEIHKVYCGGYGMLSYVLFVIGIVFFGLFSAFSMGPYYFYSKNYKQFNCEVLNSTVETKRVANLYYRAVYSVRLVNSSYCGSKEHELLAVRQPFPYEWDIQDKTIMDLELAKYNMSSVHPCLVKDCYDYLLLDFEPSLTQTGILVLTIAATQLGLSLVLPTFCVFRGCFNRATRWFARQAEKAKQQAATQVPGNLSIVSR